MGGAFPLAWSGLRFNAVPGGDGEPGQGRLMEPPHLCLQVENAPPLTRSHLLCPARLGDSLPVEERGNFAPALAILPHLDDPLSKGTLLRQRLKPLLFAAAGDFPAKGPEVGERPLFSPARKTAAQRG
jgi:hypothetical protein